MTNTPTCDEENNIMKWKTVWLTLTFGLLATPAFAEDVLNTGDTAWMIVSTALVMMMTPAGLALFLRWHVTL
jgi:Amt family ammonium transporter